MLHTVRSFADFDRQLDIAGGRLVVVDFTASRCRPCKSMEPKIKSLLQKYQDQVVVLKVDVIKLTVLAFYYKVSCVPTFIFFRNGRKIDRVSGADKTALEYKVSKMARKRIKKFL